MRRSYAVEGPRRREGGSVQRVERGDDLEPRDGRAAADLLGQHVRLVATPATIDAASATAGLESNACTMTFVSREAAARGHLS